LLLGIRPQHILGAAQAGAASFSKTPIVTNTSPAIPQNVRWIR
jgi:hypothetical protein